MSFTYGGTPSTDLEKVRLEIGDTDSSAALFSDEEIQVKLGLRGAVLPAAADLCDILAVRFAREFDFSTDGQSFSRGQRSRAYAQLAQALRVRGAGVAVDATVRVDGNSQDIDFQTVESSTRPRIGRGYTDPDLPV